MLLPAEAQPLLAALLTHLTRPTYARLVVLTAAAIITTGRQTVANLLRAVGGLTPATRPATTGCCEQPSGSGWRGVALSPGSCSTTPSRSGRSTWWATTRWTAIPGRTVCGKGRLRDAVRSSHAFTAWRYVHTWVVLAVLVQFPFARRRWALPVLVDLYRSPEVSRAEGVRHRTPARLRLTLVSKCHPDANRFAPAPPYAGTGRPRRKGQRVPKTRQAAATTARARLTVNWYGGGTRDVEAATAAGQWYNSGSAWCRSAGPTSRTPPARTGTSTCSPQAQQ